MAKPEWGIKRICPSCGLKYYDFNNSPITCPSCKVVFDPDMYLKSRKGKSLTPKVITENNNEISNLDDIEVETNEEAVGEDDPILEINKEDNISENEEDVTISDDINFIEDEDLNEDDENSVEIIDDQQD